LFYYDKIFIFTWQLKEIDVEPLTSQER
jgi:hypothetical protein